jgi:hypothetical protein
VGHHQPPEPHHRDLLAVRNVPPRLIVAQQRPRCVWVQQIAFFTRYVHVRHVRRHCSIFSPAKVSDTVARGEAAGKPGAVHQVISVACISQWQHHKEKKGARNDESAHLRIP